MGIVRNHYVGRTFIEPTQEIRDLKVKLKLSPIKHLIEGKRVAIIDDSLVRGTTSATVSIHRPERNSSVQATV